MKDDFKIGDIVEFLEDNPSGGSQYGVKGQLAKVINVDDDLTDGTHDYLEVELMDYRGHQDPTYTPVVPYMFVKKYLQTKIYLIDQEPLEEEETL
ncbi:hypothetical protein SmphiM6_87 [Sinorhizobium phage phiM6]|nr:hypothetical protein SmphiM6_87 [Sinorhizobium phage phiM6]